MGLSWFDPYLGSPMYVFLRNFSVLDTCYAFVTLSQLLAGLLKGHRVIALMACATQTCIFLSLVIPLCLLLAIMAYDCYLAVCHPLHYMTLMSPG